MTTIEQFADDNRIKLRKDSCGEIVIPGKPRNATRPEDQSHIFENGDGRFGVCLLFPTPGKWTYTKQRLTKAGFEVKQNGDAEGTLLFDPSDRQQAKAAIREAGIKTRRTLSPEHAASARLNLVRPEPRREEAQ
jgi:hypothetical protein